MSYLSAKFTILALLVVMISTQGQIPSPDPSWDDYRVKSCCPKGFIEVLNYCVQCQAPNIFDSIDQQCKACPSDHTYNKQTQTCDCTIPCALPRVLNANKVCQCPADSKGTVQVYDEATKSCNCPANLPLWNGKYCVKCPDATEYDPKEKQCYHCPEGFIRDTSSHSCIPGA